MSRFEATVQAELPLRPFLSQDSAQETVFIRRGVGPRQMEAIPLNPGEVLGNVGGVLQSVKMAEVDSVSHVQSFSSDRWTIIHNRKNTNVQVVLYDIAGNQFEPDNIIVAANTVTVRLAEPEMGRAILIFAAPTPEFKFQPVETVIVPEELGDIVAEENTTLPEVAVRENGTMLSGTGNTAENFTSSRNAHIALDLGARIRSSKVRIVPSGEVYLIELADTQSWTFPHSAALLDITGGTVLTNFYDITLTAKNRDTAEELTFTLVRVGNKYTFVSPEYDLAITDGAFTSDLSVYQDIQSLSFYAMAFPLTQVNGAGGMIGTFDIEMKALPKADLVLDAVTTSITVITTAAEEGV